jgi:phospholipid N-methyltransferase
MMQFVTVALRNYKQVGAVCPSSPALCRALADGVSRAPSPKRVLEAGPGTGPVTKIILDSLRKGDRFDLVELSPDFCAALQQKILDPWKSEHPGIAVHLHNADVQEAPLPNGAFDFIVCGLPFNNFPSALVRQIMDRFMELLKPSGELAYFCYAGMRTMKGTISSTEVRQNLHAISALEGEMMRRHKGHRQFVLANIPPAHVLRLRKH